MSSDVDRERRAKQATTILLAAYLYKSHKIDKGLQKMANLQEQALQQNQEMLANQDRANIIAETQIKIQLTQAQQIERTKLLKNTFFESIDSFTAYTWKLTASFGNHVVSLSARVPPSSVEAECIPNNETLVNGDQK